MSSLIKLERQSPDSSIKSSIDPSYINCFFKSNPEAINNGNQKLAKQSELYDKASFKFKSVASSAAEIIRCKKSMIDHGYLSDPFVECFLGTESLDIFDSGRRFLYWLRFKSVQAPQEQFLRRQGSASDSVPRQIVNLGCGMDTTCFNLLANPERNVDFKYFEIDFPQVVNTKTQIIREDPKIRKLLGDGVEFGEQLQVRSDRYVLASSDITKLDHLDHKLRLAGIDFDAPTMVVTEFVLAYIESKEVEALVDYFTERFPCICFVDFCTSNIDSEFGRREMTVFQQRGIPFKAKEYYYSPSSVRKTYEDRGFVHESMTMQDMLDNCIDESEKKRIYALEPIENSDPYFFEKMKYSYIQISKKYPTQKPQQQELFQIMQSVDIATAVKN